MKSFPNPLKPAASFFMRIHYNSPVILTFAVMSLAVLAVSVITNNLFTFQMFAVYRSPISFLFFVRLFGYALGHANFEHFFGNFIVILIAGPMLEEKYGSKKMALMISMTVLATGLLHILFSDKALLGASGVVFMLILLASFANLTKGKIPLTLILCVVVFIGREVFAGLAGIDPGISRFGHVFGGISGAAFGVWLNKDNFIIKKSKDTEV
jgi:membrane associated rhomboid family serine protease